MLGSAQKLGGRRRLRPALLLAVLLLSGSVGEAPPIAAQGFGWGYYRTPAPRRRSPRRQAAPQRPAAPPPAETAKLPPEPPPIPMPVARPRFPGDPPPDFAAPATPTDQGAKDKPVFGPFRPPPPQTAPGTAGPPAPGGPPLPPPKPPEVAKPEGSPGVAPSGARLGEVPGQPEDDATCQDRLKARGVEAAPIEIGPQPDPRCTVVRAVRLTGLTLQDGAKLAFPERPTIACPLADAFSLYIRDLLSPLAKGTYGAPLASVWTGPGLECRARDHIQGAKLSSHGLGLAVDIAQIKLADGRMIEVGKPAAETDRSFDSAARAGACGYFHTALGPGTDAFHATHWHFDIEVRGAKGDSKYCK